MADETVREGLHHELKGEDVQVEPLEDSKEELSRHDTAGTSLDRERASQAFTSRHKPSGSLLEAFSSLLKPSQAFPHPCPLKLSSHNFCKPTGASHRRENFTPPSPTVSRLWTPS